MILHTIWSSSCYLLVNMILKRCNFCFTIFSTSFTPLWMLPVQPWYYVSSFHLINLWFLFKYNFKKSHSRRWIYLLLVLLFRIFIYYIRKHVVLLDRFNSISYKVSCRDLVFLASFLAKALNRWNISLCTISCASVLRVCVLCLRTERCHFDTRGNVARASFACLWRHFSCKCISAKMWIILATNFIAINCFLWQYENYCLCLLF